jgi:hypothetical protein
VETRQLYRGIPSTATDMRCTERSILTTTAACARLASVPHDRLMLRWLSDYCDAQESSLAATI